MLLGSWSADSFASVKHRLKSELSASIGQHATSWMILKVKSCMS